LSGAFYALVGLIVVWRVTNVYLIVNGHRSVTEKKTAAGSRTAKDPASTPPADTAAAQAQKPGPRRLA